MELYTRIMGSGPPLIILHGLFGLSDNWVSIARRLSASYTVYLPDQRNHGRSPHHQVFNYYALSDDLMAFMDSREIDKAVLLGHSMGGKVAMHFALDYPEMTDKLIVADMGTGSYHVRPVHNKIMEAMESVDFDSLDTREAVEEHLSAYIDSRPLRLFIMKNLKRLPKGRLGWKPNLPVLKKSMGEIVEGLSPGPTYNQPTLFVAGGRSDYIKEADHQDIQKFFPKARIEVIPHGSHWLHADATEAFCDIVSHFLDSTCYNNTDLRKKSGAS